MNRSESRGGTVIANKTHRSVLGSMGMGFDQSDAPFRPKSIIMPMESFSMLKGLSRSEMGLASPQNYVVKVDNYDMGDKSSEHSKPETQSQNEMPPWTVVLPPEHSLNSERASWSLTLTEELSKAI